jgi:hypothetical protein
MWKFDLTVFDGAEAMAWQSGTLSRSRLFAMLDAVNEGFSHLPPARVYCGACRMDYSNFGTFLRKSPCPVCSAEAED